ncbi:MAG: hypothetical protein WCB04_04970 [Mycobacteriales bacterium]
MKTYRVQARRWAQDGWELHIEGVGVTQSATLATAFDDVEQYLDLTVGPEDRELTLHLSVTADVEGHQP